VRQRRGEVDICFSTFNSLNSGGRKEERKSLSIEMKNRAQMKARFWDGGGGGVPLVIGREGQQEVGKYT